MYFGCFESVLGEFYWYSRVMWGVLDVFSVFRSCWMSFVSISECFECLGCFQHDLCVFERVLWIF